MKHNRSETEKTGSEITFVRKTGTALAGSVLAVLAVGAVGVYAMVGGNTIPVNDKAESQTESAAVIAVSQAETDSTEEEIPAETSQFTAPEVSAVSEMYNRSVNRAAVTMRKAGLDEYDLILETVKATETTASSKKTETAETTEKSEKTEKTAAKETEKSTKKTASKKSKTSKKKKAAVTTEEPSELTVLDIDDANAMSADNLPASGNEPQSEVKSCAAKSLYSTDKVNLRTDASLNADVIAVLPVNAEVIVTGYTEDWYRVKFDGNSGYCMKKYFTEAAPEKPVETLAETADVISYTDAEFDMLCYVLQGEVGNCSEASKIAVANVIINRVKDPRFPDTIEGVLTQPSQFDAIYGYYGGYTVPSENTIECARRALAGEDNTNGAIYYYAPQYVGGDVASWFESLELCLELDGQRYFK